MFERNRLNQIANMLLPAALQTHVGKPEMFQHVMRVNDRLPLAQYLIRVVDFVAKQKMDVRTAMEFSERLSEPDVLDIIYIDALPILEKGNGNLKLTAEEIKNLRLVRAAVKWYEETAYRHAHISMPANDHYPPRPLPA